jgi:hypothetical protein
MIKVISADCAKWEPDGLSLIRHYPPEGHEQISGRWQHLGRSIELLGVRSAFAASNSGTPRLLFYFAFFRFSD